MRQRRKEIEFINSFTYRNRIRKRSEDYVAVAQLKAILNNKFQDDLERWYLPYEPMENKEFVGFENILKNL